MKKGYKSGIYIKCVACGKEVYKFKSQAAKAYNGKHFCSSECYNKSKNATMNPNWKGKTEIRKCKVCGKTFSYIPLASRPTRGQYCSIECKKMGTTKTLKRSQAKEILEEIRNSALTLPMIAKIYGTTARILKRMLIEHYPDQYESAVEGRRMTKDEWYRKGRSFEIKVKKELGQKGYIAMLSPHSKGAADLIALKDGKILCVQCKVYGTMTKSERRALNELCLNVKGIPILCCPGESGKPMYFDINNKPGKNRIKVEV